MNDSITNIAKQPTTEITVELFDSNGNLKYKESGENHVYDFLGIRYQQEYQGVIARQAPRTTATSARQCDDNWNWFRYVHLTDIGLLAVDEAVRDPLCPVDGVQAVTTGYVDRDNQTIGDNPKIGIINREESYACDKFVKFVYEFGSTKAVGQFNCVVHSGYSSGPSLIDNGYTSKFGEEACYIYGDPSRPVESARQNFQMRQYANGWNQTYRYDNIVVEVDGGLSFDLYPFGSLYELNIPVVASHIVIPSETWAARTAPTRMMARQVGDVYHYYFWVANSDTNRWIVRCSFNSTTSVWTKTLFNMPYNLGSVCDIDSDAIYLAASNLNVESLYRIIHSESSYGSMVSDTNTYPPRYFNGKVYGLLNTGRYDLASELPWDGSVCPGSMNGGIYQDVANPVYMTNVASGASCGDWYYYETLCRNDITNSSNGSTSSSYLARRRFDNIRRFSSSAYRLSTPINKGIGETLKITYQFNFTRE